MLRRPDLELQTDRLVLTLPPPEEAGRVARYYQENREHHGPWDPPRPEAFFTPAYWRTRLVENRAELEEDRSLRLFISDRDDRRGAVLGAVNFTSFTRGAFQACRLGYSLDQHAVGKGIMTEALRAAVTHVFEELGFHRIEANYIPTNERSGRVLRRVGFVVEGYARDYLFIAGQWRDHVLTSLTSDVPQAPA